MSILLQSSRARNSFTWGIPMSIGSVAWESLLALAAAVAVSLIGWLLHRAVRTNGMFAGTWTAKYRDTKGIEINEVLELRSLLSVVWGTSTCHWEEDGPKTGRYKVRGLFQANCLMGLYIPAVSGEHDMGVFIVLINLGARPTTADGLTTNFESDERTVELQSAASHSHNPRQQPLAARTYSMARPKPGEV